MNAALFEIDPILLPLLPLGWGSPKAGEFQLGLRIQASVGLEPILLLPRIHNTQPLSICLLLYLLRYEAATEPIPSH